GLEDLKTRVKPLGEVITYLPSSDLADENKIELDIIMGSDHAAARVGEAVVGLGVIIHELPGRKRSRTAERTKPGAAPGAGAGAGVGAGVGAGSAAGGTIGGTIGGTTGGTIGVEPASGKPATASPREMADEIEAVAEVPSAVGEGGLKEEDRPSLKSVSQTVRVDIRKLDHLMNIVGELVLARSGIMTVLDELRQGGMVELTRSLHRETRALERRLNELQSGILEVRMVPLGQMFDKLSRVVRKISRDAGKKIRFQISGADTELDKLIVEELSDPLMHIIRNAIDHGIEPAEARERIGKNEVGTLTVSAQQKGNHVVIEVTDDGAGFDEERILEIALRRGFLDAAAAAELSRRDLLNLVFLPGFSTKDQATELSGRGVGMDVVKTNIARLSGIIDIASVVGKGSTITITLPITLAIIQALIIRVAGRTYAVPLNSVLESLAITRSDTRTIEGRQVLTLRGQTLALVHLDVLFSLSRDGSRPEHQYVVVVGLAQHRLGLVVDELTGQQDIVIKNLGKSLSSVTGIAGATELGGQQTVLVLDVASLVEETLRTGLPEAA
ncbi:MAG: chemotaxis protein CheA, partial [Pseudomonadota bacterium]